MPFCNTNDSLRAEKTATTQLSDQDHSDYNAICIYLANICNYSNLNEDNSISFMENKLLLIFKMEFSIESGHTIVNSYRSMIQ